MASDTGAQPHVSLVSLFHPETVKQMKQAKHAKHAQLCVVRNQYSCLKMP